VFARYFGRLRVVRPDGRVLLRDCGHIAGDELRSGVLGEMSAAATAFLVGQPDRLPRGDSLIEAISGCSCLVGASEAPNQAGLVVRMLAPDGGVLRTGIEAAFHVAGRAALGAELTRRRK